jgi:hypothetical protein
MDVVNLSQIRELRRQVESIPYLLEELEAVKEIVSKHSDEMRFRILLHDVIQMEIDYKVKLNQARRFLNEKRNT